MDLEYVASADAMRYEIFLLLQGGCLHEGFTAALSTPFADLWSSIPDLEF